MRLVTAPTSPSCLMIPQITANPKTCTKPSVAEQLMMLAAGYLELAERALRLHERPTAICLFEIESRRATRRHGDALGITPERNS
jgi:hypothetical protein